MPELVDDTRDGLEDNWKPALAYGLGTGIGRSTFGPLGHGGGALLAGSYAGGAKGDAMAAIGMGEGLAMLLSGGGGGGGNAVTEV